MNRSEAGRKGGLATVKKHGRKHMKRIAALGAEAFHKKYYLRKLGTSDFAIVNRETGVPTGKTIRGLELR